MRFPGCGLEKMRSPACTCAWTYLDGLWVCLRLFLTARSSFTRRRGSAGWHRHRQVDSFQQAPAGRGRSGRGHGQEEAARPAVRALTSDTPKPQKETWSARGRLSHELRGFLNHMGPAACRRPTPFVLPNGDPALNNKLVFGGSAALLGRKPLPPKAIA